jgi:hypothetical protein
MLRAGRESSGRMLSKRRKTRLAVEWRLRVEPGDHSPRSVIEERLSAQNVDD